MGLVPSACAQARKARADVTSSARAQISRVGTSHKGAGRERAGWRRHPLCGLESAGPFKRCLSENGCTSCDRARADVRLTNLETAMHETWSGQSLKRPPLDPSSSSASSSSRLAESALTHVRRSRIASRRRSSNSARPLSGGASATPRLELAEVRLMTRI